MSEVTLKIEDSVYHYWQDIQIYREMDSIDTVEFSAPFVPDDPAFRETFRPFSFKSMELYINDEQLFPGTIVPINPQFSPRSATVQVGAYALPGVLNDCPLPIASTPTKSQFNGLNFQQILLQMIQPFGLEMDVRIDPGAPFKKIAYRPGDKVLNFLSKMIEQRNGVITNTAEGKVLVWDANATGSPVVKLTQGASPLVSVKQTFNPQDFYSEVSGILPSRRGSRGGSKYTVPNARLQDIVRPFVYTVPDARGADLATAVPAKMGRMLANSVRYVVSVDTWHDPAGELWRPNTTVLLKAPKAMVYDYYELLMTRVGLTKTPRSEVATLELVLPGSFGGAVPEVFPWDG